MSPWYVSIGGGGRGEVGKWESMDERGMWLKKVKDPHVDGTCSTHFICFNVSTDYWGGGWVKRRGVGGVIRILPGVKPKIEGRGSGSISLLGFLCFS